VTAALVLPCLCNSQVLSQCRPRSAQPCAAAGAPAGGSLRRKPLPRLDRCSFLRRLSLTHAVRHRPRSGQGAPGAAVQGAGARLLQQPAQQARQHRLALRQRLEQRQPRVRVAGRGAAAAARVQRECRVAHNALRHACTRGRRRFKRRAPVQARSSSHTLAVSLPRRRAGVPHITARRSSSGGARAAGEARRVYPYPPLCLRARGRRRGRAPMMDTSEMPTGYTLRIILPYPILAGAGAAAGGARR